MRKIKNMMLKDKLIVWFVLAICVPCALFITVTLSYQNYLINIEINRYGDRQIAQLSERLDLFFTQIRSVSRLYFYDNSISNIIENHNNENKEQYLMEQLNLLKMQKRHNANLADTTLEVTIITEDSKIYGTGLYNSKVEVSDVYQTDWYQRLNSNPWEVLWIRDSFLNSLHCQKNMDYIYNVWVLKNLTTFEPQGLLIIGFKESDLKNLYSKYMDRQESFFILGSQGEIISYEDHNKLGMNAIDKVNQNLKKDKELITINHKKYYVLKADIPVPGWQVGILTSQSKLLYEYNNFAYIIYLVFILYVLIASVFTFLITKNIISPIHQLWYTMEKARKGKLGVRCQIHTRDEIGQLSSSFNLLLDEMDSLLKHMIEEQEYKRQAEMQSLYAQINPHFIYNTLTAIRYLVYTEEKERVDYMIKSFTSLLKNSLSDSRELCTIIKELDLVNKYMEIQQMSFETPIQIITQIDPEIGTCMILKLILQPVVENSVMHGFKGITGNKILSIQVYKEQEDICIQVSDNGIGTDKVLIFEQADINFTQNIGLKNIHSRIVLHYGAGYGIRFESCVNKGTIVTIKVPLIQGEGEFF